MRVTCNLPHRTTFFRNCSCRSLTEIAGSSGMGIWINKKSYKSASVLLAHECDKDKFAHPKKSNPQFLARQLAQIVLGPRLKNGQSLTPFSSSDVCAMMSYQYQHTYNFLHNNQSIAMWCYLHGCVGNFCVCVSLAQIWESINSREKYSFTPIEMQSRKTINTFLLQRETHRAPVLYLLSSFSLVAINSGRSEDALSSIFSCKSRSPSGPNKLFHLIIMCMKLF